MHNNVSDLQSGAYAALQCLHVTGGLIEKDYNSTVVSVCPLCQSSEPVPWIKDLFICDFFLLSAVPWGHRDAGLDLTPVQPKFKSRSPVSSGC